MPCLLTSRLAALSERSTRLAWLAHWAGSVDAPTACGELETLLTEAEARSDAALLGLISVVQWASSALDPPRLHALAEHVQHGAGNLSRLLRHGQECPLEFDAEHRMPPKQGTERPLTLGERKNLARRSGRKGIARLLRDPHPAVLQELMHNPLLTEPDLVRLVTLRPPSIAGICALLKDGRWLLAPRVRMGILHNRALPLWQTEPLLWLCTRPELLQLGQSSALPEPLRETADLLRRRRDVLSERPPSI